MRTLLVVAVGLALAAGCAGNAYYSKSFTTRVGDPVKLEFEGQFEYRQAANAYGVLRINAQTTNIRDIDLYIRGCDASWTLELRQDDRIIRPAPPDETCESDPWNEFPQGAIVTYAFEWNTTRYVAQNDTYQPAPAGEYVASLTFEYLRYRSATPPPPANEYPLNDVETDFEFQIKAVPTPTGTPAGP